MSCKNKFWIENPPDLLCNYNVLPMKNMDLEEQMNSLTRMVIALFIPTLAFTNLKFSLTLLIILLVIIVLYYFTTRKKQENYKNLKRYKKTDLVENYKPMQALKNYGQGDCDELCGNYGEVNYDKVDRYNKKVANDINVSYIENAARQVPPSEIEKQTYYNGNRDRFEGKWRKTGSGPEFFSYNQALAGNANPRTMIKPVITPRCYDLKYWRANELIDFSQINSNTNTDTWQSGYNVSNCCNSYCSPIPGQSGISDISADLNINPHKSKNCNYSLNSSRSNVPNSEISQNIDYTAKDSRDVDGYYPNNSGIQNGQVIEGFEQNYLDPIQHGEDVSDVSDMSGGMLKDIQEDFINKGSVAVDSSTHQRSTYVPECSGYAPTDSNWDYSYPYRESNGENPGVLGPLKPGTINTACGYNPDNIKVNLPTNQIAGPCQKTSAMSEYNKNLYTQTIQPGVYSQSQVNQPLNANIGISFQQQFSPITCSKKDGNLKYTQHDPRLPVPMSREESNCGAFNEIGQRVTNSDVYDPRFTGYGTSYRSYTDELTGQPRYMYDDVDAVRMPNYITRNKLDFNKRMPHYGPMATDQEGLGSVKKYANNLFTKNTIDQRNSLMERWMEKQNTILAQRRQAPITGATSGYTSSRRR